MFRKLLAVFIVVPIIEMMLLIEVGKRVGTIWTIALVLTTGVIGLSLARAQGLSVVTRLQRQLEAGYFPEDELIAGVVILCGALLLFTPGLLTDTMGFFCLLPATRSWIVMWGRKLAADNIRIHTMGRRYSER